MKARTARFVTPIVLILCWLLAGGIGGLLLLVTLSLVLVILVLVYRAVLLPFVVLLTSVFALAVALLANWWLATWGGTDHPQDNPRGFSSFW